MGPGCLIYLAALKGIPDDFYEAADIDGAGFIDKILFVLPIFLNAYQERKKYVGIGHAL